MFELGQGWIASLPVARLGRYRAVPAYLVDHVLSLPPIHHLAITLKATHTSRPQNYVSLRYRERKGAVKPLIHLTVHHGWSVRLASFSCAHPASCDLCARHCSFNISKTSEWLKNWGFYWQCVLHGVYLGIESAVTSTKTPRHKWLQLNANTSSTKQSSVFVCIAL